MSVNNTTCSFIYNKNSVLSGQHVSTFIRSSLEPLRNIIEKLLTTRHQQSKCKYEKCGIYQTTCPICNVKYVGQIGRPFKVRFWEHLCDFKYRNRKSRFAQHLIDNGHNIGQIEDIMDIVHIASKGKIMDTLEKYYIFCETKLNNEMSDKLTIKQNITWYYSSLWLGLPDAYTQSRQQPLSVTREHHSSSQWY